MELARKYVEVMREYDEYEYQDYAFGRDPEDVVREQADIITENPAQVISELLDIISDLVG